ncbi:MAG: PIN domain-containing protein [Candidatus Hodarchaeales archaeon]
MQTFNNAITPSVVVDTGILIEFLTGTKEGQKIFELIFNNSYIVSILITPLTLIEIYYLIRRKSTKQRAIEEVNKITELVTVFPLAEILNEIGEVKAVTTFSLTDASSIALADFKQISVIFKHEKEIDKQLQQSKSSSFTGRIVFIDDFPYFQS